MVTDLNETCDIVSNFYVSTYSLGSIFTTLWNLFCVHDTTILTLQLHCYDFKNTSDNDITPSCLSRLLEACGVEINPPHFAELNIPEKTYMSIM